ncbi:hypothetical protein NCTGTJJY_CDS0112 [Serratia phage 92A1]|nr:hypothetical protein NCTGTJJY_CDS0112 [Serratia phage 92A1]
MKHVTDLDVCSAYLCPTLPLEINKGFSKGELNVIGCGRRVGHSGKTNIMLQHLAQMSQSERMSYFLALSQQYEYKVEDHDAENARSIQSLPGGRTRQEDLEYTQTFNALIERFRKSK